MNTDTTEAAEGSESRTKDLLCADIKMHLRQLAPHIKERKTNILLQKSLDEIERLGRKITDAENYLVCVEREGFLSLKKGSETCESLGLEMVGLAADLCPEHYNKFVHLYTKHHNANCGPLHRWANDKLDT